MAGTGVRPPAPDRTTLPVLMPGACRDHEPGWSSLDRPARLAAVERALRTPGLAERVQWRQARPATDAELLRVHTRSHLDTLEDLARRGGGPIDVDTYMGPGSLDAARAAAGAGLTAVDVLDEPGAPTCAFVAVRPPGHHARPERGAGFCIFNNVAVTAAALLGRGERVAIIDWDAHHGDGTQVIFWDEPRVLYVSLHQHPAYPETGAITETGGPEAPATTLNLPLPPGATGDVYLEAFDRVVVPVVERFEPDWILVSAGFDAHHDDPHADLALSSGDFGNLAGRVGGLVPGGARAAFVLEGGYALPALEAGVLAVGSALVGVPVLPEPPTAGGPGNEVVDRAVRLWGLR